MPQFDRNFGVKVLAGKRGKYVLRWKEDGKLKEKSTPWICTDPKNYEKARANAKELERQFSRIIDAPNSWEQLCDRYEQEHLSGLSKKTGILWRTSKSYVNLHIQPMAATDITASELSRLASILRNRKCSENTIATYMRHLLAALRWAKDLELIDECPKYRISRRAKGRLKTMRSRPVTPKEFDRILRSVSEIRKEDSEVWKFYLKALWWSGLRMGESLELAWDWSSNISIDLDCKVPRYRILAEGQKSHRDEILPIAPEFVELLQTIPASERQGAVFNLPCCESRVARHISAIGREANVVVSPCGKTATAHDLRRSFGSRWATKLSPAELRVLMRHSSIDTTMRFYVQLEAEQLGRKLWSHVQ